MSQTLEIPLVFTGNARADVLVDENDPLELLMATEDLDDDMFAHVSGFPSRSACLSAWTGRIYGRRDDY